MLRKGSQLNPPDAVRENRLEGIGSLDGEAGLAHPTWTGDGYEPGLGNQAEDLQDLFFAADERGEGLGEVGAADQGQGGQWGRDIQPGVQPRLKKKKTVAATLVAR